MRLRLWTTVVFALGVGGSALGCNNAPEEVGSWPIVRSARPENLTEFGARIDMRLGTAVGAGPDAFGDIGAYAVDETGSIYVLDFQAQEIRVFDRQGGYRRTLSRKGEGPGEMTGGAGLAFDSNGDLWVWDFQNARYSRFDPDGTFLESVKRTTTGVFFGWRGGFSNAGDFYDFGVRYIGQGEGRPFGTGTAIQPVRVDLATGRSEPLAPFSGQLELTKSGLRRPLGGQLTFALAPTGDFVVGHQSEYRLWWIGAGADTLLEFGVDGETGKLSRGERDSLLGQPWGGVPLRPDDLPKRVPVFRRFFVASDGRVVVTLRGDPNLANRQHDIFLPTGELIARLTTPVPLIGSPLPQMIGDTILGVTVDSLDVEYFVRLVVQPYDPVSQGPM